MESSNRLVYDESFIEDAYNELPPHMRSKDNLVKLLYMISKRWKNLSDQTIKLTYFSLIDNAEGVFLRDIAQKFGIPPNDQSDVQLKALIRFRALKQDSEGTRTDIVKLLRLISGSDYVIITKSYNNYVEATFARGCLPLTEIGGDLQDLFPINTNLLATTVKPETKAFAVGWEEEDGSVSTFDTVGVLGWSNSEPTEDTGYASVIISQTKRV